MCPRCIDRTGKRRLTGFRLTRENSETKRGLKSEKEPWVTLKGFELSRTSTQRKLTKNIQEKKNKARREGMVKNIL